MAVVCAILSEPLDQIQPVAQSDNAVKRRKHRQIYF